MEGRVGGVRGFFLDHVRVTVVRGASGGAAWSLSGSGLYSSCLGMLLETRYAAKTPVSRKRASGSESLA